MFTNNRGKNVKIGKEKKQQKIFSDSSYILGEVASRFLFLC